MKLTPEIEIKGLKAYEQVCAFERLRSWRLPLMYVLLPLIALSNGEALRLLGHESYARVSFFLAILFAGGGWLHWKRLNARYQKNLQLLRELEGAYGDQLPWIKVENHFAALDRLKEEIEEEKRR